MAKGTDLKDILDLECGHDAVVKRHNNPAAPKGAPLMAFCWEMGCLSWKKVI